MEDPPRVQQTLVLCALGSLLSTLPEAVPTLAAQTIIARAIEADTRRAIAGAIVVVIDSRGQSVAQALSNEGGRVSLRVRQPGMYRLRADRIGHAGIVSDAFSVVDTVSVSLVMPAERIQLPEISVISSSQCESRAEGEQAARLWEEARKALTACEMTSSDGPVLAVRRFRRYRTLRGELRADSTIREFTTRASPFVSIDAATIHTFGFVQGREGEWQFLGPDARLLLSDTFLEDHCFHHGHP